jgi:Fe-S-cluster-containing hydrogenase component 2
MEVLIIVKSARKKTDNHDAKNYIYEQLARYLDDLPAGLPSTKNGIELKLLRRFFNEQEAALALHVTLIPEEARVVAHRAGLSKTEVEPSLKEMAAKGLLYSIESLNRPTRYMINQMVIGIWEYHVNDLDPTLIRDMNEYVPALLEEAWKVPQLRTIPVNQSLSAQLEVMTYEKAEELLRQHKKFAVAPCICRREKTMIGEGCQAPEEACLIFDSAADYYLRNGLGREIDINEASGILREADRAGLVLQPSNSQKAANICCCCGCCCAVLRNIKKYPKPAELVSSPFYAESDPVTCDGCAVCLERCPMDAITLADDYSTVTRDRCIGCGLCVTTCPTHALQLFRKPENEQPYLPKTNVEKYIRLAKKRGKLSPTKMVMMQIKSKVDRLLAR